jgi:SOS-response transcriptional repressor LexA|tara:strand:+ start:235 stop:639 length:405 start_codon:yes stop_codon:yes gene_type:complete
MQMGMTKLQRKVYEFIRLYIKEKQVSPAMREIRDGVGQRSVSHTHSVVQALVARGHISQTHGVPRSITIIPYEVAAETQAKAELTEVKNIIGDFVAAQDKWQSFFKHNPQHPDNQEVYAPRVQRHFEKLKSVGV